MTAHATGNAQRGPNPFWQLVLARLREFFRVPEAIFWVYGFPLLMVVALGVAFRGQGAAEVLVDVEERPGAEQVEVALSASEDPKFKIRRGDHESCRVRLRTGRTDLIVIPTIGGSTSPAYEYWFDKDRPESKLARATVDDALQVAAGRRDPAAVNDHLMTEPGGRYVDYLIPGLLGMSLMGGGLWGVGFAIVDMRIKKLLKRFLATPMKKTHFLGSVMTSRMLFLIPEVLVLVLFARFAFGVVNHGNPLLLTGLIILGALTFAGVGLLVASRARTLETASGLMNLVMLPMWVLSGIFFSSERFPAVAQPFIQALPLTPLISALRAVMLEGAGLFQLWTQIGILVAWCVVTFVLALRWFRWN